MRYAEITEAPATVEIKARRYYHGTYAPGAVESILRNGIQPGAVTQGKSQMDPVKGKVYLTPSLPYAIIYAIGGDIAGHDPRPGTEGFGYVFVVDGNDLGDVLPDEDSVGEFLAAHLTRTSNKGRIEYSCDLRDGTFSVVAPLGAWGSMDYKVFAYIWNSITPRQREMIAFGEYAYYAAGGKRALKKMPADIAQWLIQHGGAHVAHDGAIHPIECWKIDRTRTKELAKNGSNFFQMAERIS